MELSIGYKTDIGKKRKQNQDSGGVYPEIGLFIVADGMGGHQGGETASRIVIETLPPFVSAQIQNPGFEPRSLIAEAIQAANSAIFEKAQIDPGLLGMGTTTTAILVHNNTVYVGHVGDSRCYLISHNAIWQVTRDHSLVEEKYRAGLITREQIRTDQMKNIITRSVGFEPNVQVDVYEMTPKEGDIFLLCSDGLSGMLDEKKIFETIDTHLVKNKNPTLATEELIRTANANGGEDNITALVLQIGRS